MSTGQYRSTSGRAGQSRVGRTGPPALLDPTAAGDGSVPADAADDPARAADGPAPGATNGSAAAGRTGLTAARARATSARPTGTAAAGTSATPVRAGAPGTVPRTVVVTGVSRYLGARVAARLAADDRVARVIGVDSTPPDGDWVAALGDRLTFVRADLRTVAAARAIAEADADAVVHLSVMSAPDPATGGRGTMKEHNVIGTMQVLAACQHLPRVRKVVVRSSTAAYGASFRDPAVFTEDTEPREVPRGGFARDVLDIEGYARAFRRRRPAVTTTILRFAPFIGYGTDTSLSRYFTRPVVPTVFGRDPRLQFIHVDDALEVVYRAVVEDHPGTYNVAGPGVLTLSQAVRRAGRLAVPVLEPGMSTGASVVRGMSLDQVDLFVHGRVVDVSRLVDEFGFQPRPTSEAFADFVRDHHRTAVLPGDRVRAAEQAMLRQIRTVRRQMGGAAGGDATSGGMS